MNKRGFIILIVVFTSSLTTIGFSQHIFWDLEKSPSSDITSSDFKFKYGSSSAKSLGDMEVYDSPDRDPLGERSQEPQPYRPEALAPIAPQSSVTPPPRPERINSRPPAVTDIQRPSNSTESATSIQKKESQQEASPNTQKDTQKDLKPSPSVSSAEPAPPVSKKMKWGQTEDLKKEEPKADDGKPKYRWGQ